MRKIISIVLSFGLLFQQSGLLYAAGEINLANYLSQAKSAIVQPDVFQPARLRYISYDMANNDFKLLLDKGNAKLNDATPELFNYFLIGLALPNDTFWVNLRPDAPENIIDPILEKTDIGKIFLEADLQLKKDTASLTSPQNPEGKSYWDKLYKKAGELFGTENITIPTITRPWIVPNEVIVRETEDSAYIYKATLKVMLESDYLIGRGGSRTAPTPDQYAFSDPRLKELNEYSTQLIRETIIPKLTKEINSSKRYAKLRQVYYSLVLSRWFKQKYSSLGSTRAQGSSAPANSYISLINSGNLANLTSQEPCDKQAYFQAYQKSFKDGEYNLKETVSTPLGQSIRNYISGGISVNKYNDIGIFRVGAKSDKVYKALTSGSPILNLWGLFNKKKETKNPIKILYDGYKKGKDNDEPDVVADRMLNVIFHFNGGIDKKDIQKIIGLLEKAEKIKPYFYKPILAIFNEAVKNWDDKSSIVEVRDRIRVALDTFVIDKGEGIIKFINDFLSRNKNKEDGFVQELQEYINDKKKKSYDYYVVIANSLHYKRHQLEETIKFLGGPAYRKRHNFIAEISLLQGFDVVKYDERVLAELMEISPIVDDMLIADFILNYSKLLIAGSPLKLFDSLKDKFLEDWQSVIDKNMFNQWGLKDEWEKEWNSVYAGVKSSKEFIYYKTKIIAFCYTYKRALEIVSKKQDSNFKRDVEGPLSDCLTVLEKAKKAIEEFEKEQSEKGLADSPVGEPLFANGKEVGRYVSLEDLQETIIIEEAILRLVNNTIFLVDGSSGSMQKRLSLKSLDYLENTRMAIRINSDATLSLLGMVHLSDIGKIDESMGEKKIIDALRSAWEGEKGERSFYSDSPIGVALPEGAPKSWRLVRFGNLSEPVKSSLLARTQDVFPESIISEIVTDNDAFVVELNDNGEINIVLGSWIKGMMNGIYIRNDLDLSSRNKEIISDTLNDLMAGKKSVGSSVVGEELIEGLRFVSYEDIKKDSLKLKKLKSLMKELNNKAFKSIAGGGVGYSTEYAGSLAGMYFAVKLDDDGNIDELKGILHIVNGKIETLAGENEEIIKALEEKKKSKKIVSSAVEVTQKSGKWGGIDLTDRALHIKLERVGSFASTPLLLPQVKNTENLDLDKEFKQIEALASSGIVPNSHRLLELFTVCHYRGEFGERLNQIISCLKAASAIQEAQAIDSDEDFRLALMMPEVLS